LSQTPEVRAAEIRLSRVEKRYWSRTGEVQALAPVDLAIRDGEFIVLLGPSGCGKTTILRMVGGLLDPSAGDITVGGRNLWRHGQRDKAAIADMGFVFQDANLFPWLSISQNIALPLKLRGQGGAERLA
jgi:NitT/TauT family transport system ATP-binding protein